MKKNHELPFMKIAVAVARIIVGVLFVLSGLIKADDPLGLSYKMQEFFEVWNSGLSASNFFLKAPLISLFAYLHEHSLPLAILMITFEVMAGIALLIGWKPKAVVNWLLILIVFFTFLTGYAYASGKFKNCGCFGDCIPISPLTSFLKDVGLLVLILFLLYARTYIKPVTTTVVRNGILLATLLLTLGFQWYVLNYLPAVDCLPFKKGNNISEQMKIPPDAIPDSFAIRFVYEKGGKQFQFSPSELPADLGTYHFVSRKDELIRKGNAEPAIKGFALTTLNDTDSTQQILNDPRYSILFFTNAKESAAQWLNQPKLDRFLKNAAQKNIPVYAVTTTGEELQQQLNKVGWSFPVFTVDGTVFRTAARTNPCIYLIQKGTIINKWSEKEMGNAFKQLQSIQQRSSSITDSTAIQ